MPWLLQELKALLKRVAAFFKIVREGQPPMQQTIFPDHFSSLFQSAAADFARSKLPANAPAPGLENENVSATTCIASLWNDRQPIPDAAPAGITATCWNCAKLGFELMQAASQGHAAQVAAIQADTRYSQCDPGWFKVILNYVGFLAASGMRDEIPYIPAGQVSAQPLPMKPGATVAIIGDWGTGTAEATALLGQVAAHKPDVLIHLGDIYYSGTPAECQDNFRTVIDHVFGRPTNPMPVFSLSGNHDMYSGGEGYYGLLPTLNAPGLRQPASFFCLRSEDNKWQFAAMDTGLHDNDPFNVDTVLTFLEPDEQQWLTARIAEFEGKTILLSHHQLFSALAQIGPANAAGNLAPVNPYLLTSYMAFAKAARQKIAAWFWGHEHMLTIYEPYQELDKGRCVGCGAIPVAAADAPYEALPNLSDVPPFRADVKPMLDEAGCYAHVFAILQLGADGNGTAAYYQNLNPGYALFTEPL
jgi:hypothetical protein